MRYKRQAIAPKPRNPQPTMTPEFAAQQFGPAADLPPGAVMGKKPITTRFPLAVEQILLDKSQVSDRSAYIRAAVLKQLQIDGLLPQEE